MYRPPPYVSNATRVKEQAAEAEASLKSKASDALDTVKSALSSALPSALGGDDEIRGGPQELIDRTNARAALARKGKPQSPAGPRDVVIGKVGVVHPEVLGKFDIDYPCSALEFDLEVFL